MLNFRFRALSETLDRQVPVVGYPSEKISDFFGSMVFNHDVMREYLTKEAYNSLMNTIERGEKIDRRVADQVASSMKAWAMKHGATHYTHWFQPLTGTTAEKHDSFVNPIEGGKAVEEFSGSSLIQQEPDASSFPHGGIRNTFEARGYTAWDPTSPAFIMENTLCIPTIFVSYTGESLDFKTPLLKSIEAIDRASVRVCRLFDEKITKVFPTLGWEQEYFLVDSALFAARPDLLLSGRTLFGHSSAKDQQLHDHYFGIIHSRARAFMRDFEIEAHKLGIPLKTRHNEVAPSQFECAPVYEEANVAVDHNQLLMHLLDKVSRKHYFKVLLHEKPYQGVNGSGKHNNWSLATNTGENLLNPGRTSSENLRFLAFLVNILKAVHTHEELLRACIASESNDLRLGGNEAPPAIISAFIGNELTQTLNEIEQLPSPEQLPGDNGNSSRLSIPKIPEILLDNTDRNRTSPFAFTGNKFEFRAVGSTANPSEPTIVLNSIVADQLNLFFDEVGSLIESNMRKEDAIFSVIKQYVRDSRAILFEGNNYSDEWKAEAKSRGLSNHADTPDAVKAYISEKVIAMFERLNVLNERELQARYEMKLDKYTRKLQIESRLIGDLSINHIVPTAIKYQNTLIENVRGLKEVLDSATFAHLSRNQIQGIKDISEHLSEIRQYVDQMEKERKTANRLNNEAEKAQAYCSRVKPFFDKIRYHVDKLELLVDDQLWPLVKYRELLFIK
ncbi:glutamine synthetase III [Bacteroidales bacterium]